MSGRRTLHTFEIYRWPFLVAVVIALGLGAALSGVIVARWFSWLALAFPLAVIVFCVVAAARTRKHNR